MNETNIDNRSASTSQPLKINRRWSSFGQIRRSVFGHQRKSSMDNESMVGHRLIWRSVSTKQREVVDVRSDNVRALADSERCLGHPREMINGL